MTAMFADTALAIGGSFTASLLVKVTLTLALALALSGLARRSRAAVRHLLLAAAFAVLLALPAASFLIPSRDLAVPIAPAVMPEPPAAIVPMFAGAPAGAVERPVFSDPLRIGSSSVSPAAPLWAIWAAGVLLCLLPLAAGIWQMRSLRRSGATWPRGRALVRALTRDAGVHRRVDVLLHGSVPGPMTCGFVRPAILLPPDAETWSEEELRRAMIHELEHVRRGDWASQCMARVVCAVYWFHPLVWIAWRRLGLEAERACDDAVLRRAEATAYADQLVLLAKRLSTGTTRSLLAMAACRDLTTRVRAVLDGAQTRGRAGAMCVATAIVTAAVLVTAIAPLRAVPQGPSPAAGAQEPVLAFETASVRPNTSGVDEQSIRRDPRGALTVRNMPLRALITFAYQIQGFQLEGGPDWITSARFDIVAKPEGELPVTAPWERGPDALRLMLRTLLADRFKLGVHKETRELPMFELVLARRDGRPGPQLRPSATDCAALMAAALKAARSGGPPPGAPGPEATVRSGACGIRMGIGRIEFGGSPLTALADTLSPLTQRIVVDRTGLSGNWDFELTFTPDQGQLPPGAPPPGAQPPNVDPDGPSIFTALEEQLGLKLQATRGPVEVLVIDSVEQPTEN